MSQDPNTDAPSAPRSAAARLNWAGAAMLLASWLAAALIFLAARAAEPTGDQAYGIGWDKRYEFQMERFGGKAAVMADDFASWFSGLWHGRSLAYTVAFLGTAAALLCFVGARVEFIAPEQQGGTAQDGRATGSVKET